MIGEFLDINGVAPREWVIVRDSEDARLPREGRPDDEVGLFQRHPRGHHLNLAFPQRTDGIVPRHLGHLDAALRVRGFEGIDDLDDVRAGGRPAENAEPQRPLETPRRGVVPLEYPVKLLDHWSYVP